MTERLVFVALCAACALVVAGCGGTNITRLIELEPLAKDAPVEVIVEAEPSYTYQVVCRAEVRRKGMAGAVRTTRDGYKKSAKRVARSCGVKTAIIQSLSGYTSEDGADITVTILGIRKTSQPSRFLENPGMGKRLGTAAATDNADAVGKILARMSLSRRTTRRAPADSKMLNEMMQVIASTGPQCPVHTIRLLHEKYDVVIKGVSNSSNNITAGLLLCPFPIVEKSFGGLSADAIEDIAIGVKGAIASTSDQEKLKALLANYKPLHPRIMEMVEKSCSHDDTSQLCLMKPVLMDIQKQLPQ